MATTFFLWLLTCLVPGTVVCWFIPIEVTMLNGVHEKARRIFALKPCFPIKGSQVMRYSFPIPHRIFFFLRRTLLSLGYW